jgi:hypothetical protein
LSQPSTDLKKQEQDQKAKINIELEHLEKMIQDNEAIEANLLAEMNDFEVEESKVQ